MTSGQGEKSPWPPRFTPFRTKKMPQHVPIPLKASPIDLSHPDFKTICEWSYEDEFVGRLLRKDIPTRVMYGSGQIWVFRDPDKILVGFGTLDICPLYADVAGGVHPYIPLLAVNPGIKSKGYGNTILNYLISAAAIACKHHGCCDWLFLDVYTTSDRAIALYERNEFDFLGADPESDEEADGKPYWVMAKQISKA